VIACFFGIIFGLFAFGLMTPCLKAISEGKAAGKNAFEVMDRKTEIPLYKGKKHTIKGKIEFKNVDFYYP